jgi:hypothetical protein
MTLSPPARKFVLTVHVGTSVGLLGAIAAFLALAIVGLSGSESAANVYPAMDVVARYVLVPLALAALAVGTVSALGTPWGLLSYYWVVFKLVLTALATLVLLMQIELIAALAESALAGGSMEGTGDARFSVTLHAGGGLLVMVLPLVLSIYKPRGRTPLASSGPASA